MTVRRSRTAVFLPRPGWFRRWGWPSDADSEPCRRRSGSADRQGRAWASRWAHCRGHGHRRRQESTWRFCGTAPCRPCSTPVCPVDCWRGSRREHCGSKARRHPGLGVLGRSRGASSAGNTPELAEAVTPAAQFLLAGADLSRSRFEHHSLRLCGSVQYQKNGWPQLSAGHPMQR